MAELLDLPIPSIDDTLTDTRLVLTAEYEVIGESAFDDTSALFPMGTAIGRIIEDLYVVGREFASEGTPFGATGANLDAWLEAEGITVPTASTAIHTISISGRNTFALPAGSVVSSDGGQGYTTDGALAFHADPVVYQTLTVQMTADAIGSIYNLEVGSTATLKIIDDDLQPKVTIDSLDNAGSDPADDGAKSDLLRAKKAQANAAGTAANYRFLLAQLDGAIGQVFSIEAYPWNGWISLYPLLRLTALETQDTPWIIKIPTAGQLSTWETALQADDVRSVNDRVVVDAVIERLVPMSIELVPNNATTQASAMQAMQVGFATFYAVNSYTIPNSEIGGMIANAAGVTDHTLLDVDGLGPNADAVADFTNLLQVDTVVWS